MSLDRDWKTLSPAEEMAVCRDMDINKSKPIIPDSKPEIGSSELYLDPKMEAKMMRKFDLVAIGLLGMLYMLANLDRSNIGNAKTAGLATDIHLKGNQYGNAVTLLYATYVPFEGPAAVLLKIIGPQYLLSFCAFAWGFFEAGLIPCINVYISMVYKKEERGKRSSIIFAFSAFASAFGGLLAFGLTQIKSGGYLTTWRILFLFEGLLTIAVVPLFFFGFPREPRTAWFLSEEEKRMMNIRYEQNKHWGIDEKFTWVEVVKVFKDPKWYAFWIFQFSVDVSLYGFTTFLPSILTGLGYKSYHSNLMTVPIYLWGLIWFLMVAWASDRYGMRGPFIAGPLLFLIIGYAILLSVASLGVRYFACYIIVMGIYPTTGMSMMWLSDNVAQHYKRATMIGLSLTFGNTAGVAVGQIFTTADSPRYKTAISISMGLAAVALVCVFSLMAGMTIVNKRRAERIKKAEEAESYLKKLEAENSALRKARLSAENQERESSNTDLERPLEEPIQADGDAQDSLLEVPARATQLNASARQTAFVGESACTAFGDQLLSCLGIEDATPASIKKRDYSKPFLEKLDQLYKSRQECEDKVWICKLFVVLALGELYANRHQSHQTKENSSVPGTEYFLVAIGLLQDLHEEASVQQVEVLLLLSFYSNVLGRTNSAYVYSGLALRLSLTLGLHRVKPPEQITDPVEHENGLRVWWTVYVFDRLSSSRLGHPITIHDDDIDVPLPSAAHLEPADREKFTAPEHLCANIKLARITGEILHEIYGLPRANRRSFVHTVRKILTSLRTWDQNLPESLRWRPSTTRPVASLHLHFNLCIIQTTRPILFGMFKIKNPFQSSDRFASAAAGQSATTTHSSASEEAAATFSPTTLALSEACIQAARASNNILTQCFIENSLAVYGYFDAHYLFSSTLILIMSAVMEPNPIDSDAVQTGLSLLQTMRDSGNISANGYYDRLTQIKIRIARLRSAMMHIVDRPAPNRPSAEDQQQQDPSTGRDPLPNSNPHNDTSHQEVAPTTISAEEPWSLFPFPDDLLLAGIVRPADHIPADFATDPLDNPFIRDFLNLSGHIQGASSGWNESFPSNVARTEGPAFSLDAEDNYMQF
ncbi:hypothetical protein MBLNU459_g3928t2 [Dothideomycetes sp. NU459]